MARIARSRFLMLGSVVVVVLGACLVSLLLVRPVEPVFEGRGAIEWFDRVQRPGRDAMRKDEIFQGLGPDAILCLLAEHDARGSVWGRRYQELWRKFPSWMKRRLPVPSFRSSNTFALRSAFAAIGPDAIPKLMELTGSSNREWRMIGFDVIGRLRFQGYDCLEALPLFLTSLRDEDAGVQRVVGDGLRHFGAEAVEAVPELRRMIVEARRMPQGVPRWQLERVAITALRGIGPAALDAAPELLSVAYDTNAPIALEAVKALRYIQVVPTNLVSTIRKRWSTWSPQDQGYAVKMLDEVSSDEARKGVDLLVKGLSLPAQRDRMNATNVLRRIAPEVLHERHETTRTN